MVTPRGTRKRTWFIAGVSVFIATFGSVVCRPSTPSTPSPALARRVLTEECCGSPGLPSGYVSWVLVLLPITG